MTTATPPASSRRSSRRHVGHRLPSARSSAAVSVSTATCAALCCVSACTTASAARSSDATSVKPGFVAVADDAPALARLLHRGAADRFAGAGRVEPGDGDVHVQAGGGLRLLAFQARRVACSRASASRALSANPWNTLMRATAPTTQLDARAVPGAAVELPAALRRTPAGGMPRAPPSGSRRRAAPAAPRASRRAGSDRLGFERREVASRRSSRPWRSGSSRKTCAERLAHQLIELARARSARQTRPGSAARAPGRRRRRVAGHRHRSRSPASRRLPASSRSARAVSTAAAADWRGRRRDQHPPVGLGHARRPGRGRPSARSAVAMSWPMPAAATFALVTPSNSGCSTVTAERKLSTASG